MPSLPQLPFGLEYAVLGLFLLSLVGAVAQEIFTGWMARLLGRFWRRLWGHRRTMRPDVWTRYAAWVSRTYRPVKLGFVKGTVQLDEVYVPLQYEQDGHRVDIYRDIQSRLRTVVVGPAGAGKSMLLRHSMLRWAEGPGHVERVPVLVELGRYNLAGQGVEQLVVETLARPDAGDRPRRRRHRPPQPLVDDAAQVVPLALAAGRLCVFLDGFDEVVTDRRAAVALEIKEFAERHPLCQIVVTCRDAVYDNDLYPGFDRQVRIAGFDDAGIRHFLRLWFGRRGPAADEQTGYAVTAPPPDPREQVEQVTAALRANPTIMRLARTPLMLAMITTLYEADHGEGPLLTNSRAEFYKLAVDHLLRREVVLGRHPDLVRHRFHHRMMALRAIALAAQGSTTPGSDRRIITEDEIYTELDRLLPRFRLPPTAAPSLVTEIVERSGLLVRIDDGNLLYEFAHLTLQEYLAAVELGDVPDRLLTLYRENPARWRETVKLWCAGANRDASDVVRELFQSRAARDRLLALECLAEAQQVDVGLADRIVDRFAGQLGSDLPDSHLVLAALGAVAAYPGPTGERLFTLLVEKSRSDDRISEDAVTALAESRRREAIQLLSELAVRRPAARAALRSTGELAIPVLTARAGTGSVAAVDDLAAIGTPAAAVAIAEQLWGTRAVAVRAAWRLAALVAAPDIEDELCRFDPTPHAVGADAGKRHDWLWAPFAPDGSPVTVTMGRVGWLIDHSGVAERPADVEAVDSRVALGVGARKGVISTRQMPMGTNRRLVEEYRRAGFHPRSEDLLTAGQVETMLDQVATSAPDVARDLAAELVGVRVTGVHAFLLGQLPTPLLVELTKRMWLSGLRGADTRDWLALNDRPGKPKVLAVLRNTAMVVTILLATTAWMVTIVRSVATLFGLGWAWGPWWLAVLVLVSVVTLVLALFWEDDISQDAFMLTAGGSALVSAVCAAVVGPVTAAGLVGWPLTIGTVAGVVVTMTVLSIWTSRRERAVRNPYRAVLQLGGTIGAGPTVIARAGAVRPG